MKKLMQQWGLLTVLCLVFGQLFAQNPRLDSLRIFLKDKKVGLDAYTEQQRDSFTSIAIDSAEFIIRAKIIEGGKSFYGTDGKMLYTSLRFDVLEVIKGEKGLKKGILECHGRGGVIGADYQEGELFGGVTNQECIFFMRTSNYAQPHQQSDRNNELILSPQYTQVAAMHLYYLAVQNGVVTGMTTKPYKEFVAFMNRHKGIKMQDNEKKNVGSGGSRYPVMQIDSIRPT